MGRFLRRSEISQKLLQLLSIIWSLTVSIESPSSVCLHRHPKVWTHCPWILQIHSFYLSLFQGRKSEKSGQTLCRHISPGLRYFLAHLKQNDISNVGMHFGMCYLFFFLKSNVFSIFTLFKMMLDRDKLKFSYDCFNSCCLNDIFSLPKDLGGVVA